MSDRSHATVRQAAFERVEAMHAETIGLLGELLSIPSPTGSEAAAQAWVAEQFSELGLDVDVFDCDPEALASLPGWTRSRWSYENRPNVVGVWKGTGGGRSLILNAHVDTVPADPVELWTHDPWGATIVGDRMYARGAIDDKGGIVDILAAVRALQEAGFEPAGDVILQSAIDEEAAANGTLACMARGYTADAAWMVDGSPLGRAYTNHSGQVQFVVRVFGSGGSPVRSDRETDAIHLAMQVAEALRGLRDRKRAAPLPGGWNAIENEIHFSVGRIRGGEWYSNLPAKCEIECCMAFNPPDSLASTRQEIRQTIDEFARQDPWLRDHPPEVEFEGLATEPVWLLREDDPFYQTFARVHEEVAGIPVRWITVNAWCDIRHFSFNKYTPALILGPGSGGGAHAPDEYIELPSMVPVIQFVAAMAMEWCGSELTP